MKTFDELEEGQTLAQMDYRGVHTVKVVAKKKKTSSYDNSSVCLERGDELIVVSNLHELFDNPREAWLHRGQKLQEEAAEKLREAAQAFKRAGVPEDSDEPKIKNEV